MSSSEKIAFVGIGIMGHPIVSNLLDSGYPLFIFARRPEAAKSLVAKGATRCDSAAEAAQKATVCFTMVSDTADVEAVIFAEDGLAAGAKRGSAIIDMSTISPQATRSIAARLAERGIDMLDAPVSGGEQGAIAGTLSIMVGGKESVYHRLLPILEVIGGNIVRVGEHGAGQVAKACNQLLVAQTIMATSEAIEFAKAEKVDPAQVRAALLGGFANSKILEVHGKRMLEQDYKPGFKAGLHLKDLRIACAEANAHGLSLTGLERAHQCLQKLVDSGDAELDSSAMAKVVAEQAHQKQ